MQNFLDECNKSDSRFDNLFRKIIGMVGKQIPVSFYVSSVCCFLKGSNEFNCSNYSYCLNRVDDNGINCVFLRKDPGVSLSPKELHSGIKFGDLFRDIESEKTVEEKKN